MGHQKSAKSVEINGSEIINTYSYDTYNSNDIKVYYLEIEFFDFGNPRAKIGFDSEYSRDIARSRTTILSILAKTNLNR